VSGGALTPQALRHLAAAAVAAPSADNRHAFRIRSDGGALSLWADAAWQAADLRRHRLSLLSLGAVVENVVVRAAALGWRLEPRWPSGPLSAGCLVTFEATPQPPVHSALDGAIERRHSNRRARHRGPPLAAAERAALAAEMPAGVRVVWADERPVRRRLVKAMLIAEAARFTSPELHAELYQAVRLDLRRGEAAEHGIPVGALELAAPERASFAAMRRWPLQRAANLLGTHWVSALRSAALPAGAAPHLGVILSDGASAAQTAEAGRALQRLWLRATVQGLAMQVYAALPLYLQPGAAPLTARQRAALEGAARAALPPDGVPQIVFRLGRAAPPTEVASRPPPESLVDAAP
jgi:hypothetical protein